MENNLSIGQKSGIIFLLASKGFERIAFYLIFTILIQYLIHSLEIDSIKAGYIYSIVYSVIGLTAFVSGIIGDFKDRMKIVKIGFIILPIIYLALAFLPSANTVTIISLAIMGLGIGVITPNIIVFLGNIYNEKDTELLGLSGFVQFSVIVNLGSLIAPFIAVYLKDSFGYSSVFIVASLFAALAYFLFIKFQSHTNYKSNLPKSIQKKLISCNTFYYFFSKLIFNKLV